MTYHVFILFFLLLFPTLTPADTIPSHLIGDYVLSPEADRLADPTGCPGNMSLRYFQFSPRSSPSTILLPEEFNIIISHEGTSLENRHCESVNDITALESNHPFAKNASAILDAWTRTGGTSNLVEWAPKLVEQVKKQDWVVGYDLTQRFCKGIILEAGVGYLWFQSAWDFLIGDGGFRVEGARHYLFVTFQKSSTRGCVYEGININGTGPVSDPTNPNDGTPTDAVSPPITDDIEAESPSPTTSPSPSPESVTEETAPEEEEQSTSVFDTTSSEDESNDTSACFPVDALVVVDGIEKPIGQLDIGDSVVSRNGQQSDIYFFSHRQKFGIFNFVRIQTEAGRSISLSAGHYIHVSSGLIAAGNVKIGDNLILAQGGTDKVVMIGITKGTGKVAPHTLQGDLVVNSFLVSSYTTAVHPFIAHFFLLAPVRFMYRAGARNLLQGWLDDGNNWARNLLPRGPGSLSRLF